MIRGRPAPQRKYADLNAMLAAAARTEAGITFVDPREEETSLSYRELYQRARLMAEALVRAGLQPGDRVAIGIPTSPNFMEAFFGTLLAGAVPAPLYPAPRAGKLDDYLPMVARMLGSIGARMLLTSAHTVTVLKKAAELARPELGCQMVEELLADDTLRGTEVAVTPEALGLIQFSSGSTNDPKPIALPHGGLALHAAMLDEVFSAGGGQNEKLVTWLPLYHDMGLIGCLLTPIHMGIPIIMMATEVFVSQPQMWLRAISRHAGTITVAPNFAYELCLKRVREAELRELNLRSLRLAHNGAEPVSATTMEGFSQRFAASGLAQHGVLRPVYGLAEATVGVSHPPPRDPIRWIGVDSAVLAREGRVVEGSRKLASVGVPMPGVDIEIRDEAGKDLPERQVGRIWVRTPSPMRGYFHSAELTARTLVDGWIDTGDMGFVDGGELFICGRAKDTVIIRGANHPPQDFEECLEGLEGLRSGRVVAAGFIPEGSESEELLILAERSPLTSVEPAVLEKRIRQAVLERTGIRPHTVCLVPRGSLRRTTSGKIRRRDALQRFLAGEFTSAAEPQTEGLARSA